MRKYWIVAFVMTSLIAILAFPIANQIEKANQIESIDGMVYSYIVGKVEGNDDLLASILTDKAQGIIKPGRHAFPGDAEEMGERYSIVRYSEKYEQGAMFYRVKFFRPSTGDTDFYNIVVVNDENGWLIAKNSSVDEHIMVQLILSEQPEIVHEWEEVTE